MQYTPYKKELFQLDGLLRTLDEFREDSEKRTGDARQWTLLHQNYIDVLQMPAGDRLKLKEKGELLT